jgi:hypothetical protein
MALALAAIVAIVLVVLLRDYKAKRHRQVQWHHESQLYVVYHWIESDLLANIAPRQAVDNNKHSRVLLDAIAEYQEVWLIDNQATILRWRGPDPNDDPVVIYAQLSSGKWIAKRRAREIAFLADRPDLTGYVHMK